MFWEQKLLRNLQKMGKRMKYKEMGEKIGALVDEKNAAYGSSFQKAGEIMQVLYPDGIGTEQYIDALAMIRVIDKLFRIANRKDAFGESPWQDIAGYALLLAELDESSKGEVNEIVDIPEYDPEPTYTIGSCTTEITYGTPIGYPCLTGSIPPALHEVFDENNNSVYYTNDDFLNFLQDGSLSAKKLRSSPLPG